MPEAYHSIWVLENFPLGAVLAEFLDKNLSMINLPADVIPPELYPELLNVDFRNAADEDVQAAFLSNIGKYSFTGITLAVLHINSQKSLNNVEEISKKGIKILARIPSKDDARRDLEIKTIKSALEKSEIPYADYN